MAMSMRSRGGAASANRSRLGVRPVYEDFKPTSEWQHEEGADILLYHLPGFVKEQIKIIAESRGVLRVRGERFIASSKWSRFQDEVLVPEDCDMSEIRAKFEGGILRITMPKKTISTDGKHTIEEHSKTPDQLPRPSIATQPYLPLKPQQMQEEMSLKPQKLQEEASSKPMPLTTAEKPHFQTSNSLTPWKGPIEQKNKMLHEESTPKATLSSVLGNKKNLGGPESTMPENSKLNKMKGSHEEVIPKLKETNETYNTHACERVKDNIEEIKKTQNIEGYKTTSKSRVPRSLEEDRQLLMNMGVAILVIVALGVHIGYSFSPSGKSNT